MRAKVGEIWTTASCAKWLIVDIDKNGYTEAINLTNDIDSDKKKFGISVNDSRDRVGWKRCFGDEAKMQFEKDLKKLLK